MIALGWRRDGVGGLQSFSCVVKKQCVVCGCVGFCSQKDDTWGFYIFVYLMVFIPDMCTTLRHKYRLNFLLCTDQLCKISIHIYSLIYLRVDIGVDRMDGWMKEGVREKVRVEGMRNVC